MADANVFRIWRSGDDLLLVFPDLGMIELDREAALALAAEISGCYTASATDPQFRRNRRWTAEDRAEVCRLYVDERLGVDAIAKRFKCSGPAIHRILYTENVPAHDQKRSAQMKRNRLMRSAA